VTRYLGVNVGGLLLVEIITDQNAARNVLPLSCGDYRDLKPDLERCLILRGQGRSTSTPTPAR
jgi:hypothetical protein